MNSSRGFSAAIVLASLALVSCDTLDRSRSVERHPPARFAQAGNDASGTTDAMSTRTGTAGSTGAKSTTGADSAVGAKSTTGAKSTAGANTAARTETSGGLMWRGLAFPTGDEATSAVMLAKGYPQEVALDTPFEYRLEVTNLTDHNLEDVVISERFPEGFVLKSATPAPQSSEKGVTSWVFPKLAPTQKETITVSAAATKLGSLSSCATVTYDSRVCSTIAVTQSALLLAKEAPAEALICEDIPLKYTVTNTGTGTARNIRIADALPEGLVAVGAQDARFDLAELEPGKSREFTIKVRAKKTGTFQSAAAAKSANSAAESKSTSTVVRAPKLEVAASAPEQRFIGRNLTHKITIKNVGDVAARDSFVESTLPTNAKFVGASDGGRVVGNKVAWQIGTIAPNAQREISVTYEGGEGTARSEVTAVAHCADAVRTSVETKLVGIPAILLEVVDLEDPIAVGEEATYEIRVTNQGSADGTGIVIECMLENAMQYVTSSGPTRGSYSTGKLSFAPLAKLAPRGEAAWKVVVKASEPLDARFKVRLTSDQIERPVEETEATNFYR
jgi:uncharacterized repeat protein (TIGR01451 family)